MHEILVWGISKAYDNFLRFVDKFDIKINALVSSYDEHIKSIDGINVIKPKEIKNYNYEFIIVASQYFNEIVKIGMGEGEISRDKFIPAEVFELNGFDFNRYISVKNKNISIVSDDCWGGYIYNTLKLRFNSPFINLFVNHDSYLKLVSDIKYYLSFKLEILRDTVEEWGCNHFSEVGGCFKGYLSPDVVINFNHDFLIKEIKSKWERRLERFNFDNYIVKMCIFNDKEAYAFEDLKVKNKIGFYWKDKDLQSIFVLDGWKDIEFRCSQGYSFDIFVRRTADLYLYFNRYYDVLKLLNGEEDFKRDIVYR